MSGYYQKNTCRLCNSESLATVLELAPTPPGNHFVSLADVGKPQACYPLELRFCKDCTHVQLGHVVDPEILYQKNYTYVSATSSVFVKHLHDYAASVCKKFNLNNDDLVVEIGSNDGTNLKGFKSLGCKILGVDPATEIVLRANQEGIPTICDFFSLTVAEKYRSTYGTAKLITSHNACAHIDDLASVVQGVQHWLAHDGIFVMEVGYFLDVFQKTWFDTIYHEHLDFHTVAPLMRFFSMLGMELFDVERTPSQGGSIRLYVQKKNNLHTRSRSVERLIALEREAGLDNVTIFDSFAARINNAKKSLQELLTSLRSRGNSVAGYGAPTKATTLMTFFGLNAENLDFIVEDNPLKQGLFTPLYHIPVLSHEVILEKQPDYLLILAWNFAESIIQKCPQYRERGGKFIVPLPVPRVECEGS